MEQFIGCDAHQEFSLFIAMNQEGQYGKPIRIAHDRERMREFLEALPAGSKIALETSGSYYWLVDEMERAGHQAQLAHALTAKRRMEGRHKTDERDARGLAMLLRTARCRGCGFRPPNCATSAKCCAGACAWSSRAARSRTAFTDRKSD